ncbi:MAG TPA: hypothetical protein VF595_10790 [Tepidisphaeraceae bacterium]
MSLLAAGLMLPAAGCFKPSAANIALRKQVQEQSRQIEQLSRQHSADLASLEVQGDGPASRPALSPALAADVFTTHGVRLGRLTRSSQAGAASGGDGLVVHVIPTDDSGDDLKAAGAVTVEAFDLADAGRRVGHWSFTPAQTRAFWNGSGLRYEYVVPCPWPQKPNARELTVKVTFVDALTGRSFSAQQVVSLGGE